MRLPLLSLGRRGAWIAGGAVAFLAVFTIYASCIFLWGAGLLGVYHPALAAWWVYLYEYGTDPAVWPWLVISGGLAAALPVMAAAAWFYRDRLVRGWTWRRLARIGIAVWAVAVWSVLASIIALFMAGRPGLIGQLWWWNLLPAIGDPAVLLDVAVSAVSAAAIVGGALGIRLLARGRRGPRAEQTLYGKTEWASRDQLDRGGFQEAKGAHKDV
jgi:hypothetical protein